MAIRIIAQPRTESGKGASRRARRAGMIPAVMYGMGETVSMLLPGHEVFLAVKDSANALLRVELEGEKHLALVKDVQRHPVRRDILHVDLYEVEKGEKVEVEVPVTIVGEPAAGMSFQLEQFTLLVEAPATDLPEHIEVSVEGLEEGTVVRVSDLDFAEEVDCITPEDMDVVVILSPRDASGPVDEVAEEEAAAE